MDLEELLLTLPPKHTFDIFGHAFRRIVVDFAAISDGADGDEQKYCGDPELGKSCLHVAVKEWALQSAHGQLSVDL